MSRLPTVFLIFVAGAVGTASAEPAGVPRTQYTGEMKNVAKRILKYRAEREERDREYNSLKKDLGKVIVLALERKKTSYNDAIKALKKLDQAIKTMKRLDQADKGYNAWKNKDVNAAAQLFLKESVSVLIQELARTLPQLEKPIKAGKAGIDASIIVAKMVVNREDANRVAATAATDLDTLNRLIAKDKEIRQRKPPVDGHKPDDDVVKPPPPPPPPPVASLPDDDFAEINRWIDGGDRSAFGSEDSPEARARKESFYERYPILEQFRDVASFRSPSDEFEEAGGFALLADPPSFDPLTLSPEEFEGWLNNQEKIRPRIQSYAAETTAEQIARQRNEQIVADEPLDQPSGPANTADPAQQGAASGTKYDPSTLTSAEQAARQRNEQIIGNETLGQRSGSTNTADSAQQGAAAGTKYDPSTLTSAEQAARQRNEQIIGNETLGQPSQAPAGSATASSSAGNGAPDTGNALPKALNQITKEDMGSANPYTKDLLIPENEPLDSLRQELIEQFGSSQVQDLRSVQQSQSETNDFSRLRAELEEGSLSSSSDLGAAPNRPISNPTDIYIHTNPATPLQIANARRALENAAKEARKAEERKTFAESGGGNEPKESGWARALPWINLGLGILDQYAQIRAQQQAQEYQRMRAQQQAQEYQRIQAQQRQAQAEAQRASATGPGRRPGPPAALTPINPQLNPQAAAMPNPPPTNNVTIPRLTPPPGWCINPKAFGSFPGHDVTIVQTSPTLFVTSPNLPSTYAPPYIRCP